MFGDAALAARIADALLEHGVYVIAFCYPGRAAGQGAHPRAAVGGAQSGRTSRPASRAFVAARAAVA